MITALTAAMAFAKGPGGPGGPRPGGAMPHHSAPRPAPVHHHHHGNAGAFAAGVVGGAIVGGLLYDAVRPAPVVVAPPPPVVVTPAPVVVTTAPVYETRNVWVEGRYVDRVQTNGSVIRVWEPGHYEQQSIQVR